NGVTLTTMPAAGDLFRHYEEAFLSRCSPSEGCRRRESQSLSRVSRGACPDPERSEGEMGGDEGGQSRIITPAN
ncbi:MAG: hypothetical protein M1347_07840, partial [Chloroflexi bacterium]|nr:hypothetical protein [Chloroflexota bacterium]